MRALGLAAGRRAHRLADRRILNDERSVLEVRHAAAEALADLGNAAGAGRACAEPPWHHSFLMRPARGPRCAAAPAACRSSRKPARSRNSRPPNRDARRLGRRDTPDCRSPADFDALVFIKGNNDVPNTRRRSSRPTAGGRRTW